jgi:hypothetical protein
MTKNPWGDLPTVPPFVASVDRHRVNPTFQERYHLHCDVLPVPFIGNPMTAMAVLLYLNPRYDGPSEAEAEVEVDGYAKAFRLAANLESEDFFPLNPRFERTGSGNRWPRRLQDLVEACGLDVVRRHLAVVQFCPYRSKNSEAGTPRVPSQDFTFEVVHSILHRPVPPVVVIMQGRPHWREAIPGIVERSRVFINRNRSDYVSRHNLERARPAFDMIVRALCGPGR